jgi:hypothetical protein
MDLNKQRGYPIEEALQMQMVTLIDYEKYKDTRPKG